MTGSANAAPAHLRLREGGVAMLFLLAAALALYLISRTDAIYYAPQHPLYLVTAAVMALTGKKKIQSMSPPAEKTIETVKDDIAWAKHPTQAPPRS